MVHELQQSGCLCAAKRTGRPELVNVFPTMFYTDFETAIIKAVTTMCPGCEVKMSFPFTTELVAEHTIFGTQQALWKIESELSQFLKKIFRLSPLPPAEFSDCIALDFVKTESIVTVQRRFRIMYHTEPSTAKQFVNGT